MPSIEWILIVVLAALTLLFAGLWVRARSSATAVSRSDLPADTEVTLLAKSEVNLSGAVHQYGVVSAAGERPLAFLIDQSLGHLQVGDAFSMRNGQPYKVETRKAAVASGASSGHAQDSHENTGREAAANVTPSNNVVSAPSTADQSNPDDDPGSRTVLYVNEDATSLPDVEKAYPFLEVLEGADAGTRFPIPYAEAGIGRSENNVIALADNGASRQHCRIDYRDNEFTVEDLGSTNGTFHNGEEVSQPRPLAFGDRIQVSDSIMEFRCEGYVLKDHDADGAIHAFEQCLQQEPDFLEALKNLAFLLERDIRRKKEAEPIWKQINRLEKGR